MPYFECNICLETARNPVVSRCGHLFCWPCLYQWFRARPRRKRCPVCRAPASKTTVIPIISDYNTVDPRTIYPQRITRLTKISTWFRHVLGYLQWVLCLVMFVLFLINCKFIGKRKYEDFNAWQLFPYVAFMGLRWLVMRYMLR